MFGWFRGKTLEGELFRVYPRKVHGIKFGIKKINALEFLAGTKALRMHYSTYEVSLDSSEGTQRALEDQKAFRQHYSDVFLAAVAYPVLKRKNDPTEPGIWVESLFTDMDLCAKLYEAIMEVTYGKKNLKSIASLAKESLKPTP